MKKTIIACIALLSLFPFAMDTFAAGEKPSKKENSAQYKQAELTKEQENALYVITTEYLRERQPIEKTLAQKQAEYNALMRHTNPNVNQAGELAAEISTLEYTLMNMSMRFHHQIAHDYNIPMTNCTNGGCPDMKRKKGSGH